MLKKLRDRLEGNEEGFTLIELLVVVIIIGILAAIAIPTFLNQRENAWRSSVESDARNLATQLETCYARDGEYPADATFTAGVTQDICETATGVDVTVSDGVTLDYTNNGQTYTIEGSHDNITGESVTYDSATGGLGDWQ